MTQAEPHPTRILAVDDDQAVLDSYRNLLGLAGAEDLFADINSRAGKLYGGKPSNRPKKSFELVICRQGDEAVRQVELALQEGRPFSVAFIDVRMPPGPDGVWVARQVHALDPCLNIVIVTAYSDVPPHRIAKSFQTPARLFYIQKPFHWDEIRQFAVALGENTHIQHRLKEEHEALEEQLSQRTSQFFRFEREMQEALADKLSMQEELEIKTQHVQDVNTALRVLLEERDRTKIMVEENVKFNLNEYVLPNIAKLKNTELTAHQQLLLSQIEQNLQDLTSSFSPRVAVKRLHFTPVELQVANLIKHGSTTKDIAEILNLSVLTIESYRKNIRKKMGLTNTKENLRTRLLESL